jgi:hypothetical protein
MFAVEVMSAEWQFVLYMLAVVLFVIAIPGARAVDRVAFIAAGLAALAIPLVWNALAGV